MRKRSGRPPRYAAIPNTTIDDATHLDLTALGLLAVLLRHRDGWEITLADIGARYGYGEDALARAMGLLQVARYVVKIRIMSTEGNRWSTDVVVYDTPATDEEIAALLDEIAHEQGVRQVQLIPPTKTALAHAEKRRNRLSPDSGKTRSRGDLRKHGKTPARPDSGVFRDPGNPGVIKKTVLQKTKNTSSPSPLTDVQESHTPHSQEEAGDPRQNPVLADAAALAQAAELVGELPTAAERVGAPLPRPLTPDEIARLTAAAATALARGWTIGQLRTGLTEGLASAQSAIATWHYRLRTLGDPPPAAPKPKLPPKCGECGPSRLIEDDEGNPIRPCPTCYYPRPEAPAEAVTR